MGRSLLDLADLVRGVSYERDEARPHPGPGLVPIVRANNIQDGAIVLDDLVYVPESRVSAGQLLRQGDIVIAMSSGSRDVVGKAALVTSDWPGGFGAFCGVLRPRPGVNSRWLALYLRSDAYREEIDAVSTGTNINNLSKGALRRVSVPDQTMSNQEDLVALLEQTLMATEDAQGHINDASAAVARFRRAVLGAACTGQLTEDWRERNVVESLETTLERISVVPSRTGRHATDNVIPGDYALSVGDPGTPTPAGWQWLPLTLVARLETGHTPSRKHPEYWTGDVPWIGIQDARVCHGTTILDTRQHTNELGLSHSAARLLPRGTVCLSRTASVGYVVMMGREMATSQDFVNWVCSDALLPDYLMLAILAEGAGIRRFGRGTTHTTIYFPEVKAIYICLPPVEEQRRICEVARQFLDEADLVSRAIERSLGRLSLIESSALTQGFRGELGLSSPTTDVA